MLISLSIRDIVLIDALDIEFGRGLSVLTGETGAGKSILLDAFALAIGARGDASLVRQGVAQGQVTATFEPGAGHPAYAQLAENGIGADEALILRRVQSADGRSRAFINDTAVSVQLLRQVGAALVEIHGQHDDRALVDPAMHRDLLDAFAGLGDAAQAVAGAWQVWTDAQDAYAQAADRLAQVRTNADYLSYALEELRTLDPKLGEEDSLAARRQLMMHAEKIAADLAEALDALGGEGTAQARLSAALRRIERRSAQAADLLQPVSEAIERVLIETNAARGAVEQALAATEFDPRDLELAEERLFALRALARKHRVEVDGLPDLLNRFESELAAIDRGEAHLAGLEGAAKEARAAYESQAQALSKARQAAASKLDADVAAELAPLKLEKASFITNVEPRMLEEGGPHGIDRVSFYVRTNPGTEPGPLMKVASGGELARFILALKVVLAARGSAPTLVFDEVDAGVGGATAAAVGERLAKLAGRVQVLAVTHAPQIAARADGHILIAKEPSCDGQGVVTRLTVLSGEGRREEIARMLAGQTITDEARAAAERLMGRLA